MGGSFWHVPFDFSYLHDRYSVGDRCSRENEDWRSCAFRDGEGYACHSIGFFWTGWHQKRKGGELRIITCILFYHAIVDTDIVDGINDQSSRHTTVGYGEQRVRHHVHPGHFHPNETAPACPGCASSDLEGNLFIHAPFYGHSKLVSNWNESSNGFCTWVARISCGNINTYFQCGARNCFIA